ncbi:TPA: hypothetical protein N0F65_000192 [Lagenidium giganteum]|uniref:Tudor domain-containing protein n=1 Tax=Lagenidium giganteum TaxID=4803 RepID=A0AAV2YG79_9STRA|nr:TPA: hypothetical protein N0F65_000192 [Lagenidium giganteum]
MATLYDVGDRVDGLYDGNSDDMWYPGRIKRVHHDTNDGSVAFAVLYDDGEEEQSVLPCYLRPHEAGTICTGTRVFGRYAGGDEWYPGRITEVQDNGCYTIEYDDTEVETDVPIEFIREPEDPAKTSVDIDNAHDRADTGEADQGSGDDQEPAQQQATSGRASAASQRRDEDNDASDIETPFTTAVEAPSFISPTNHEEDARPRTPPPTYSDDRAEPRRPSGAAPAAPVERPGGKTGEETEEERQEKKPARDPPIPIAAYDGDTVDEYASIVESINLLEFRMADPVATKGVLSTLVKQMRAFPQVTADLIHEKNGERLVVEVLKLHHSHAVIQCYGCVLLRRLCFLCGKSTHFFLRNGIIDLITLAMHRFADDAILQASACGALAVFTRVHAGLSLLLEHRVVHLVMSTLIYHKAYSVHTRQVHYYACEGK